MKMLLIRHGETESNIAGRIQGQLDSPLTQQGQQQASLLGKYLRNYTIDHVYSSDLGRAYHTASLICENLDKSVEKDMRLRSRNLGVFQGHTWKEVKELYPEVYHNYLGADTYDKIPQGETFQYFYDRILDFFSDISTKHRNQTVMVITHGAVLGYMLRHVLQIPLSANRRFRSKNTAINEFSHYRGKWYLEQFGNLAHLNQLQTIDDIDD